METLAEYKDLWSDIKYKIIRMRNLSTIWQEREEARVSYEYPFEPTVSEKLIKRFEARNEIKIPLSYRSYLLYFGGSGPSDLGPTNSFVDDISKEDVSTPSELKIFEGTQEIDPDDIGEPHPIENINGIVDIGLGYNPVIPFLVLNGEARGYVYWNNFSGHVGGLGEFAVWYKRWADKTLAAVERRHIVFSTPIGISLKQLWDMYPDQLEHEERDGVAYVYHKKSRAAFMYDAKEHVTSIEVRSQYFRQRYLDQRSGN